MTVNSRDRSEIFNSLSVVDIPPASDRAAASSAESCVRRWPRMGLPRSAGPSRNGVESRSRRCRGAHRMWVSIATRDGHVCAWPSDPGSRHTSHNDHLTPKSFPKEVVRTPVPGRVIGQVRERPGNRLAWRGRVLPIMRRGAKQVDPHECFLLFGGVSVTVKPTRQETLHVSHFLLCAVLHFRYARLDLLASS